jgi:hypothetical protein
VYSLIADTIVIIHFLFILFVVSGGALVFRWPKLAWVHLPSVLWGALVELRGWICPLTPLENYFRSLAGNNLYSEDFIEKYLLPIIYPEKITASLQEILGIGVILVNVMIYYGVIKKYRKRLSDETLQPF